MAARERPEVLAVHPGLRAPPRRGCRRGACQHVAQVVALEVIDARPAWPRRRAGPCAAAAPARRPRAGGTGRSSSKERAPGAERERALEHVAQLAHVARPGVPDSSSSAGPAHRARLAAPRRRSISATSSGRSSRRWRSGGQGERHHRQPVVEVRAERALGHRAATGPAREAATTRTSTACSASPPTGRTSRSSSTRSSRACTGGGHARPARPGRACRRWPATKAPGARRVAPVKAPRTWPNSSLSSSPSGSAPQSTATKGPLRRALASWMARAASSLPVPGLALEQHRRVRGRHALQHGEQLAHGQALAHQLPEAPRLAGRHFRAAGAPAGCAGSSGPA